MNRGLADRAVCTVSEALPSEAADAGLDDFATLADTYLLSDPTALAVDEALGSPLAKSAPHLASTGSKGKHTFWEANNNQLRDSVMPSWTSLQLQNGDTANLSKLAHEPMDSSDWEQTRDFAQVSKTDSPESAVMSATSTPMPSPAMRAAILKTSLQETSPFYRENRMSDRLNSDAGTKQSNQPYTRMLGLASDSMGTPENFERRSGGNSHYATPQFDDRFHLNGSRGNTWHRMDYPGHSASWGRGRAQQAQSPMYRAADMLPREQSYPPHRRNLSDPYNASRAEQLRSRVSHSLDAQYDDLVALNAPSQMENFSPGGVRTSGSNFITHSPATNRSSCIYSPQQPSTPSEPYSMDKKRKRQSEAVITSSEDQLKHQEALIKNLKISIEKIDAPTKGVLKDTLYRISRNTNAANINGVSQEQRQSTKFMYLDRLVANFLYNRFDQPEQPRMHGAPAFPNHLAF